MTCLIQRTPWTARPDTINPCLINASLPDQHLWPQHIEVQAAEVCHMRASYDRRVMLTALVAGYGLYTNLTPPKP